MAEDTPTTKPVSVAGKTVKLSAAEHDEIQSLVDECLDRHAIARFREITQCDHQEACDALADEGNFDQAARAAFIAEQSKHEKKAGPNLQEKLASQAGIFRSLQAQVEGTFTGGQAKGQLIKLGVAVALLLVTVIILMTQMRTSTYTPIDVYYYDLNTGTLFVDKPSDTVPIPAPSDSGNMRSGVRAHVFTCGSCSDESSHFIGYLQRHNRDYVDAAQTGTGAKELPEDSDIPQIRALEGDTWITETSKEAIAVFTKLRDSCGGDLPKQCHP